MKIKFAIDDDERQGVTIIAERDSDEATEDDRDGKF